ncbi:MAG: trigger factor [Candidatus Edwardsbacteria bacterium]
MKVEVKETKTYERVLEVEVPPERVKQAIEETYNSYARKAKIPGFRKGKVPKEILKARFGPAIEQEAIDNLIPKIYKEALKETGLSPVSEGIIEDFSVTEDKILKFKAKLEVMPPIPLQRYKGITVKREIKEITDEDVEKELESLQNLYAEYTPSENEAKRGDLLTVDYQLLDQYGLPIIGERVENYAFELGSPEVLADFNEALIGIKINEERRIVVEYPLDHQNQKLAGQRASFLVKAKEVKEKKAPELSDEFAKTVGEFQNLQELRTRLREQLRLNEEQRSIQSAKTKILNTLIEENPFELPESMIKNSLDAIVEDMKHRQKNQTLDEEKIRESYRLAAIWEIKRMLFLEEVVKRQNLTSTEEDLEKYFESIAISQQKSKEKIKQKFVQDREELEHLKNEIRRQKAIDCLYANAEVIEEIIKKEKPKSPEKKRRFLLWD